MTSGEKILSGILDEANSSAAEIIKEAEQKARESLERAQSDADMETEKAAADAEKKSAIIRSTGKSGAALLVRDASLKRRRELIDDVLSAAVKELNSLADDEYFEYIAELVKDTVRPGSGVMLMSAADLKRDTSLLIGKIAGTGLTLSDAPADIDGGFLLKYGDIEINASFTALLHEKREVLVDCVNKELFK